MLLALPALTLAVERDLAVQLHPRHINAQQFFPGGVALGRGQVRLFVHDMLEMVHHGAIRDKGQRTGQVAVQELAGILAKEALRPRPGKEFHRHGVDFASFHAGPHSGIRHAVTVGVCGKGMTRFMRDHLNVMLGAVEVGKDKGRMEIRHVSHIAAHFFVLARQYLQKMIIQHEIDHCEGIII